MDEKRKFVRWYPVSRLVTSIRGAGGVEHARIMDVSAAGMKAFLSRRPSVGAALFTQLEIPPSAVTFFIIGEVTRSVYADGKWETGIKFDKVSTMPFSAQSAG